MRKLVEDEGEEKKNELNLLLYLINYHFLELSNLYKIHISSKFKEINWNKNQPKICSKHLVKRKEKQNKKKKMGIFNYNFIKDYHT